MNGKIIDRRKAILTALGEFKKLFNECMAEDNSALVKCSKCGKEFTTVAKSKMVEKKFSEAISQHNSLCFSCREKSMFNVFNQ